MTNHFENQLLLTTVAETDVALSKWTQRLTADRNLELGDNPRLIADIERDLQQLTRRVRSLKPHFDLSRVPLSKANSYFATTRQLDKALTLVRAIREKASGSEQNTRQCLSQLEQCMECTRQLSDLATPTSAVMH